MELKNINNKSLIKELDTLLQHKDLMPEDTYQEALRMKKDILNDIQTELMRSRRKKINKLMNIPEVVRPVSEETRRKIDYINKIRKERGLL
jgi:chemotaxis protein histidine kinase CheA